MKNINIYENIGRRTGGDIYLGVVGPVRAGKSTFIKRFMDLMVIPNVRNVYERQRILDEMPQSGTGKTITTTEPKFIPAAAAKLQIGNNMNLHVRLVDCVGYLIPGAAGHMEDGESRMVSTPWDDEKMPFDEAAETGTEKVIKDHSTVGIVITTDGSIGTLPRESYRNAEEKVIRQLKSLGKPFVVIVNSTKPESTNAEATVREIKESYDVNAMIMDCAKANEGEMDVMMLRLLDMFPVKEVRFRVPGYLEGLDQAHWLKTELAHKILSWAQSFENIEDVKTCVNELVDGQNIERVEIRNIDLGTGQIEVAIEMEESLYYNVVGEMMEETVNNDYEFFSLLKEYSHAKKEYDKIKGAMQQVEACDYGIVQPKLSEMMLSEPEVFKEGGKYGVKMVAKAPTLHIIKTDITTEIAPLVGSEKQAEDLAATLKSDMDSSENGIWQTNIFGKTMYEMVSEQMQSKLTSVPDNVRTKMQKSLQKISDEGKEYFICIVI